MSRNHPDSIFKYPPVQYIPLNLDDEIIKNYSNSIKTTRFSIYLPEDQNSLNERLNFLTNYNKKYILDDDELAILLYEGKVNYIKYRAHEIFMVGRNMPQNLQLFKITAEYFYKNKLIFTFYEQNSGERIYRQSLTIQNLFLNH